jgi:hypothetical protein
MGAPAARTAFGRGAPAGARAMPGLQHAGQPVRPERDVDAGQLALLRDQRCVRRGPDHWVECRKTTSPVSAPCVPSSRRSSPNSSTAATSNAPAPATSSWFRMTAFSRRFNPSLVAQLRRGSGLGASEPGNTLAPANVGPNPVAVRREAAGALVFGALDATGAPAKLAARYGCPHSLHCEYMGLTPAMGWSVKRARRFEFMSS